MTINKTKNSNKKKTMPTKTATAITPAANQNNWPAEENNSNNKLYIFCLAKILLPIEWTTADKLLLLLLVAGGMFGWAFQLFALGCCFRQIYVYNIHIYGIATRIFIHMLKGPAEHKNCAKYQKYSLLLLCATVFFSLQFLVESARECERQKVIK